MKCNIVACYDMVKVLGLIHFPVPFGFLISLSPQDSYPGFALKDGCHEAPLTASFRSLPAAGRGEDFLRLLFSDINFLKEIPRPKGHPLFNGGMVRARVEGYS